MYIELNAQCGLRPHQAKRRNSSKYPLGKEFEVIGRRIPEHLLAKQHKLLLAWSEGVSPPIHPAILFTYARFMAHVRSPLRFMAHVRSPLRDAHNASAQLYRQVPVIFGAAGAVPASRLAPPISGSFLAYCQERYKYLEYTLPSPVPQAVQYWNLVKTAKNKSVELSFKWQ
ncbi:unnamed protein product [Strongylus vulgaris]|uniref:Uncharacterized protein n=1 Tax=Strongylus vulgaris TaxID=40348 RepID=A0A3P7K283_STRVU|nr:unnamed protein product [Strongylus vulgaris]